MLDVSQIPSSITAHDAGYIDKDNEVIVGLQTDAPLKRAIMPNGGLKMVTNGLEAFGFKPDPQVVEIFTKYRKTHNAGVFDAYTAGRPPLPQLAHPDRASRRLWPRADHRRLSPRRALRRRPADRAQAGGEGRARPAMVDRRDHPRPRGAERADPRARRTQGNGGQVRLRHFRAGDRPRRKPCSGSISAISPA